MLPALDTQCTMNRLMAQNFCLLVWVVFFFFFFTWPFKCCIMWVAYWHTQISLNYKLQKEKALKVSLTTEKSCKNVVACPICIIEVCSYRRHNKRTGTASCSVSLKAVPALHLSSGKSFCLVSAIQTTRVQQEFKGKLKGRERFLLSFSCQIFPTWQERCWVWQPQGCRCCMRRRHSSTSCLFEAS